MPQQTQRLASQGFSVAKIPAERANLMLGEHVDSGIRNRGVLATRLPVQLQSQLLNFKPHLLMGFDMICCGKQEP